VSETWADREQRMLEAICDGEEAGEEVTLASLIDRLDLDEPLNASCELVRRAVDNEHGHHS
jgi:hypothetical protein